MNDEAVTSRDVMVVGAGAIGAAVAWRCAQRGLSVTCVDPAPDRGAWRTAAGMLGPITELSYTETPLLRLSLDALARFRAFSDEIAASTGLPTGYLECGTVQIAWDGADLAALADLHHFGAGLGLASTMLTGRELRELEPDLAPGLAGGLLAESDHQVDPRLLRTALVSAGAALGVRTIAGTATVELRAGRAVGVVVDGGARIAAGTVVLTAGAWSRGVGGLPDQVAPPVRPVRGQTLRLRLPAPSRLTHVVRGRIKGAPIYVVPRGPSGRTVEYVVGASSEEAGFDPVARAGAVYELLRDALSVLPGLDEATLTEICTGFRPGSPDNAPLVGPSGIDGLVFATGHHRNGILLSAVTADGVAQLITTGELPEILRPFAPTRFEAARIG